MPAPVYLVKLDTQHAKTVGDRDVILTLPEVPGFALEVKKGSVTFPDGSKTGKLSVTPVNASKIPMPPPNGMQPQFIVTIQPIGAKFDPPAPITLPNVDGHKPGAQVEMFSYDHDLEEFVAIGLGTVSTDGSVIKSNQGVGVIKAGWHCGSQPGGSGCCGEPGECKAFDGSCQPVADNSQKPVTPDSKGDCKKPECKNGSPEQVPDDSDGPDSKDQPCAKCNNGNLDKSVDGASCDDGSFCTDSDQCTNGTCTGKDIPASLPHKIESEVDVSALIRILEQFSSVMGVPTSASVTTSGSVEFKEICCEQKKQKDVPVGTLEFGFNGKLDVKSFPVPGLAFSVSSARIGVFITLGASASATLSGEDNRCEGIKCAKGIVGGSGSVEASLAAESPLIITLSGSLGGGLTINGTVNCESIGYDANIDGLKGKITLEFFDGFMDTNYEKELISGKELGKGSIPINF